MYTFKCIHTYTYIRMHAGILLLQTTSTRRLCLLFGERSTRKMRSQTYDARCVRAPTSVTAHFAF